MHIHFLKLKNKAHENHLLILLLRDISHYYLGDNPFGSLCSTDAPSPLPRAGICMCWVACFMPWIFAHNAMYVLTFDF